MAKRGKSGAGPVIGKIPKAKKYNTPMVPGKSTARKEVK